MYAINSDSDSDSDSVYYRCYLPANIVEFGASSNKMGSKWIYPLKIYLPVGEASRRIGFAVAYVKIVLWWNDSLF